MKKKKNAKKLNLSKETLTALDLQNIEAVPAGAAGCTQESNIICSIMHTCVSCRTTEG